MTTILPHGPPRDPRTYKEPPLGKRGAPAPANKILRCARNSCEAAYDIEHIAPERVRAFADAHGFVERIDKNGKPGLFCSLRCAELHRTAPDNAGELAPMPPRTIERAKPLVNVPTYTVDSAGHSMRWVACGYATCDNRFDVATAASDGDVARAALGHGYVQSQHGTFCSRSCARMAQQDADHGILHPTPLSDQAIAEAAQPKGEDEIEIKCDDTSIDPELLKGAEVQIHMGGETGDPPAPTLQVTANRKQRARSAKLAQDIAMGQGGGGGTTPR